MRTCYQVDSKVVPLDRGSSKKKLFKGHFRLMWTAWSKKEFLQWNTRTKDYLWANFQDIWLSSKIMEIGQQTCHIYLENTDFESIFFAKWIIVLVLCMCYVFIFLQDHHNFFLHFVLSFMGHFFINDPIHLTVLWEGARDDKLINTLDHKERKSDGLPAPV